MRAYTIKRKGKTIWQNMLLSKEIEFLSGEKIYAQLMFIRKKDAKKYLETFEHKRFLEVIGMKVGHLPTPEDVGL